MSHNIKSHDIPNEGQINEIEQFVVFRFQHRLGSGIKARLKSLGCSWNTLQHGWICPLSKEQDAHQAISEVKLDCTTQIISLPKGMIPSDPKIANRETRLEILEITYHKADMELLQDVYQYDSSLRPYDFSDPPSDEGKSFENLKREMDFHKRWVDLQKMKSDIENAKNEISHLRIDSNKKIFDPKAPLLIAEALIQNQFLFQNLRTLQNCANSFFKWNGIKYVELSETGIRKIIYNFLRDAKKISNEGFLEDFNPDQHKVNQIIDALRAICHQNDHPASGPIWLDDRQNINPKHLIAFRNGLLNLEEWIQNPSSSLIPHTPSLLNMNALGFDFNSNASEPQEWLHFLNAIWTDDFESQQTMQWAVAMLNI